METGNDLMTVWMVAQEKKVHVKSVYRAIADNRLIAVRTGATGKTVLVRREDAAKWNPRRV